MKFTLNVKPPSQIGLYESAIPYIIRILCFINNQYVLVIQFVLANTIFHNLTLLTTFFISLA